MHLSCQIYTRFITSLGTMSFCKQGLKGFLDGRYNLRAQLLLALQIQYTSLPSVYMRQAIQHTGSQGERYGERRTEKGCSKDRKKWMERMSVWEEVT